jgi:hypothetical protein
VVTQARSYPGAAVAAILDRGGIADLLRLGSTVKLPAAAGWAAAEVRGDDAADDIVSLLGTGGSDGEVARGYAGARIEADGPEWTSRQLRRWPGDTSVSQKAGLLLAVPRPDADLIAIINDLHADVRASFWERMTAMRTAPEARPLVVRRLIEHHRAWAALNLLVFMLPGAGTVSSAPEADLVESVLFAAATGPSGGRHRRVWSSSRQVSATRQHGWASSNAWILTLPGRRPPSRLRDLLTSGFRACLPRGQQAADDRG